MNKYRKERYISQRVNSYGEYSFQVRVRSEDGDIVKKFYESNGYTIEKEGYDTELFKVLRDKNHLPDVILIREKSNTR